MSGWTEREFGERKHFALVFSLKEEDPCPRGDAAEDASWGGIAIWVRGRCLTRSVSAEGVSDEVRWSLLGLLSWLRDSAIRLVNEEPFPLVTAEEKVPDACEWFHLTESPSWTLSEEDESKWFLSRSEWFQHHALRRASADVALPNALFRRLGDFLEVSWDNERWGTVRPELSFVERRGTELVDAKKAAAVLLDALRGLSRRLVERASVPALLALEKDAAALEAGVEDWRWLVSRKTAEVIEQDSALAQKLKKHVEARKRGLYVPHHPTTLLLRNTQVGSAKELKAILKLAAIRPRTPVHERLLSLIRPSPAQGQEPWRDGYERALEVREALGWGDDPAPDLDGWLGKNNVDIWRGNLPDSIDSFTKRTEDDRVLAGLNRKAQTLSREMGLAQALGHIVMDVEPQALHGVREHWPTAARARAFGAMLLLPEGGVKKHLRGRKKIGAPEVQEIMGHFGTGASLTTFHMKNNGLIDEEMRGEILRALSSS